MGFPLAFTACLNRANHTKADTVNTKRPAHSGSVLHRTVPHRGTIQYGSNARRLLSPFNIFVRAGWSSKATNRLAVSRTTLVTAIDIQANNYCHIWPLYSVKILDFPVVQKTRNSPQCGSSPLSDWDGVRRLVALLEAKLNLLDA